MRTAICQLIPKNGFPFWAVMRYPVTVSVLCNEGHGWFRRYDSWTARECPSVTHWMRAAGCAWGETTIGQEDMVVDATRRRGFLCNENGSTRLPKGRCHRGTRLPIPVPCRMGRCAVRLNTAVTATASCCQKQVTVGMRHTLGVSRSHMSTRSTALSIVLSFSRVKAA